MNTAIVKDHKLAHAVLNHVSLSKSGIDHADTISLCKSYVDMFSSVVDNLRASSVFNWNQVTYGLFHLSMLRKIICHLFDDSFKPEWFLNEFPFVKVFKNVFFLTSSSEIALRHASQNVFAIVVAKMHVHKQSYSQFDEMLDMLLKLVINGIKHVFSCYNIDSITAILRQIRKEEDSMPLPLMQLFIDYLQSKMKSLTFSAHPDLLHSHLHFVSEMMHVDGKSQECLVALFNVVTSWIENNSISSVDSAFRLLYLQIIKSCLNTSDTNKKTVKSVSYACLSQASTDFVELHASSTIFGFGGWNMDDRKAVGVAGFSKSEMMLMVNSFLIALSVLTDDERAEEKISSLETFLMNIDFLKTSPSIFELYLEQDDLMIEFLLFHLQLHIFKEKKNGKFVMSPHLLFADMLQHLAYDSSVLLDWLTSNETLFLLYFLKYLKYASKSFQEFLATCRSSFSTDVFPLVMSTIINLRSSIEKLRSKNLFPYQIAPLLKAIAVIERLSA